jgi:hypothetical protein
MLKRSIVILVGLFFVMILVVNCANAAVFNSPSLKDIALSSALDKELKPVAATTNFTSDPEQIYCSFKPYKSTPDMSVSAQWIYVKGDVKELNNYVIDQWTEPVKKEGRMAMFMRRFTNGWPHGNYKVILSVNGVEETSIPFQIN